MPLIVLRLNFKCKQPCPPLWLVISREAHLDDALITMETRPLEATTYRLTMSSTDAAFLAEPTRKLNTQFHSNEAIKRELERMKDRKWRQKYRARRRIERDNLLEQIEELTKELKLVKEGDRTYESAWKLLAQHELAAQVTAETEQKQLCQAIHSQVRLVQDFQNLVYERRNKLDEQAALGDDAHLFHRQESRELFQQIEDPNNTLALKFRVTTQLSSGEVATAIQRIVLRRYQENERMVLVWKLFTEGEGLFAGLHSDETGWGVAIPASTARVGTVIRTCVHNVPMHVNIKTDQGPAVKQFNVKLLEWGLENNEKVTTGLENLLIK
ncbi:unnamed protein product [Phytophthora fragariaefolia]|uniref:Unnamed protein product n=1 Tax=Phytophthora fragariaefolia TaxID=1490495 RepID=A0A9W6YCJ9_9STRA|nr:unnamed protein product [Phytophthora fragariaefolia]